MAKNKSCSRLWIVILASLAVSLGWISRFFNGNGTGETIEYRGSGWMREALVWDDRNRRFLVSRMEGGVSQLVPAREGGGFKEEVVVSPASDVKGNATLGIRVDAPRNRLLAVFSDAFGRKFSALAAYDMDSWKELFFIRLESPGKRVLADDVAVDDEGNAYVTDAQDNFLWKVSPDGSQVSIISSPVFTSKPHKMLVYIAGLNGIVYHPDGFLLVAHTTSGALFKVSLDGSSVEVVEMDPVMTGADGMALLAPDKLAAAGTPARLVESSDGWKTAKVTHTYYGPFYRLLTSVAVKDGKVFANYLFGFKSFIIKEVAFKAVP